MKKYPNGPMSTHLHDMNVGQSLSIRGPIPKYKWEENKYTPPGLRGRVNKRHEAIGLIAGGTGIAPMYQLIKAIFKNPNDKTKVSLVYGNVTHPRPLRALHTSYVLSLRCVLLFCGF